jgi:hypothetical protein
VEAPGRIPEGVCDAPGGITPELRPCGRVLDAVACTEVSRAQLTYRSDIRVALDEESIGAVARRGGTNAKSLEIKQEAMARAEALRPILTDLAELPALAVAAELNRRKVATPAGGKWHAQTVIRVRERLARAQA